MENFRSAKRFAVVLGVVIVISAGAGQVLASPNVASATTAPSNNDWHSLIEPLTDHPEVLTMDWPAIRAVLPAGCFRNANNGEVTCPPLEGVGRISVVPGPLGIIDIVLKAPATCDMLYDTLSKRFGKGELENGDKCYAEWKLGKRVKRGNVNFSPGRRDPSQLHLQFAIEQGP